MTRPLPFEDYVSCSQTRGTSINAAYDRIPEVDGLRAFAVLFVLLFHAFGDNVFVGGYIGVDIFFVISGFIITRKLMIERGSFGKIFCRFLVRRFFRIWPALITMISVWLFAVWILDHSIGITLETYYAEAALALVGIMNWARAFEIYSGGALGHIWSLSVEEQFYILWPIALLLLGRLPPDKIPFCILAAICCIAVWRAGLSYSGASVERTYNGLDTRADALLIGCLTAYLPLFSKSHFLLKWWSVPVAFLVFTLIAIDWRSEFMHLGGMTITAAAAAWIIIAAIGGRKEMSAVLDNSWARYFGLRSYSIYLWHYPIISIFGMFALTSVFELAISILISVLVGDISYRYIERPCLHVGRRIKV